MKKWQDIVSESLEEIWDYSSDKKKSFVDFCKEYHISFENLGTTVWKRGIPIQSLKTVAKVINYFAGKEEVLTGIKVYRNIKQNVALKRAKKICDGIGYKIIDTHDINNQGYEFPDHWISIKKK